jgi:hypothetical protein
MTQGIISLTNYYCNINNRSGEYFFLLPRRISQDLVENAFSRIRVAIGHARLDHITTFNATVEVNMMKEVKVTERTAKRRNAAGALNEQDATAISPPIDENCFEYTNKSKLESLARRNLSYTKPKSFVIQNGIKKFKCV